MLYSVPICFVAISLIDHLQMNVVTLLADHVYTLVRILFLSDESIIGTGDSIRCRLVELNRIENKPFSNIDIESKGNKNKNSHQIEIERRKNIDTDIESIGSDID